MSLGRATTDKMECDLVGYPWLVWLLGNIGPYTRRIDDGDGKQVAAEIRALKVEVPDGE